MAATERLVGVICQLGDSTSTSKVSGINPLPFGRRKSISASERPAVDKDDGGRNTGNNSLLSGGQNVSLILKAVREGSIGGAQSVIQQVSTVKQLLMLDVPYTLLNEMKKRMAFPFKEDDENASDEIDEDDHEDQGSNAPFSTEEDPKLSESSNDQSPRCSLPRGISSSSLQRSSDNSMKVISPHCQWPREHKEIQTDKPSYQPNTTVDKGSNSVDDLRFPRCSWPREGTKPFLNLSSVQSPVNRTGTAQTHATKLFNVAGDSPQEKSNSEKQERIHGPRCAWPRTALPISLRGYGISYRETAEQLESDNMAGGSLPLASLGSETGLQQNVGGVDAGAARYIWPKMSAGPSKLQASEKSENGATGTQAEMEGPRCAWPRIPAVASTKTHPEAAESAQPLKEVPVTEGGAKCAWPRASSKAAIEVGSYEPNSGLWKSNSGWQNREREEAAGPRCAWPKSAADQKASPPPKDLPRRMLATSVGLSLMNYLLVSQGASALATPGGLQDMFMPPEREDENKRQAFVCASKGPPKELFVNQEGYFSSVNDVCGLSQ